MSTDTVPALSHAVVQLMKGVVYRDTHETVWQHCSGSSRSCGTTSR